MNSPLIASQKHEYGEGEKFPFLKEANLAELPDFGRTPVLHSQRSIRDFDMELCYMGA